MEEVLELWAQRAGEPSAAVLRAIIEINIARGRLDYYLSAGEDRTTAGYVATVAEFYRRWHPYLHRLQCKKSTADWEALFEKFQRWAYNYLLRKEWYASCDTYDHALSIAGEAAAMLYQAHFPYDTDFDPWAHVLLQHACRRRLRSLTRLNNVPDDKLVPLEAWMNSHMAHSGHDFLSKSLLRGQLLDAIDQLPNVRYKKVILLRFFEGWTAADIARELDTTANAVHLIQRRALQNLRELFSER